MKLEPQNNYLIIKAIEPKKATESGIILPEGVEEDKDQQTSYGEIVAVCSKEMVYVKGDTVLFSKLVPDDVIVEIDGEKQLLWFVHNKDIKAIVR